MKREETERERVRKKLLRRKWAAGVGAVLFLFGLGFLTVRAGKELVRWVEEKRMEEKTVSGEPQVEIAKVEIIDEATGKATTQIDANEVRRAGGVSLRILRFVNELYEEFLARGYTVVRARIPKDKIREIDLEVQEVSGYIKISLDREARVSAEDAERMIKYLQNNEISEFEYIDVRVSRKGWWK